MHFNQEELLLALKRLDEGKIRQHLKVCGINAPTDNKAFWIGIHKVRATMEELPEHYRIDSRNWLKTIGIDYDNQTFSISNTFNM